MAASTFEFFPAFRGPAVNDRQYPSRPILAASVAVFRDGRALLARRARPPLRGLYSLPGGVVEIGETLRQAALRELDEEVGVAAEIVAFNDHVESVVRDERGVRAHYVIASFVARWTAGEGRIGEEVDSVMWVDPLALDGLPMTPELEDILARGVRLIEAQP
jgi:ADP-ribose pyrophosphatase YjhB (NUDIX family)